MIQEPTDAPEGERKTIGEIIRERRLTLYWMQKDLAQKSGIDKAVINRIESGAIARPAPDKLARLAEVLGLDLAEVYAAAGWQMSALLPTFQPYLRAKYGDLPPEAQERLAIYFVKLRAEYGATTSAGPADGEDE